MGWSEPYWPMLFGPLMTIVLVIICLGLCRIFFMMRDQRCAVSAAAPRPPSSASACRRGLSSVLCKWWWRMKALIFG